MYRWSLNYFVSTTSAGVPQKNVVCHKLTGYMGPPYPFRTPPTPHRTHFSSPVPTSPENGEPDPRWNDLSCKVLSENVLYCIDTPIVAEEVSSCKDRSRGREGGGLKRYFGTAVATMKVSIHPTITSKRAHNLLQQIDEKKKYRQQPTASPFTRRCVLCTS